MGKCWFVLWTFGIWEMLWPFGTFFRFWYQVPTKIWQPWLCAAQHAYKTGSNDAQFCITFTTMFKLRSTTYGEFLLLLRSNNNIHFETTLCHKLCAEHLVNLVNKCRSVAWNRLRCPNFRGYCAPDLKKMSTLSILRHARE
jgi:hypothetical protein